MPTLTIAVAGLKGGVGKTTSSVYLSEASVRSGLTTLLVDADPQGSALAWSAEALERGPALGSAAAGLASRVGFGAQLERLAGPYDVVVIDTPPSDGREHLVVRSAIAAADVAVVPLTPTALEVERLGPTLELAADTGTPAVVLVVRARRTNSLRAVQDGLESADLAVLDTTIPLREAIAASYGSQPKDLWGYDEAFTQLTTALADNVGT